ncbi:MAG: hypothetical protein ABI361_11290 [Nitrososphaera sp.]|jgi:hypothetical protein
MRPEDELPSSSLQGVESHSIGKDASEDTNWSCLDADGIVVGKLTAGSAVHAVQTLIEITRDEPSRFRRRVFTLVSGGTRIAVDGLTDLQVPSTTSSGKSQVGLTDRRKN